MSSHLPPASLSSGCCQVPGFSQQIKRDISRLKAQFHHHTFSLQESIMQLLQAVFLTVLVACVTAQLPTRTQKVPEIDQRCMECLCQASSNCDESLKCHNAGGDAYFCGPYVISWAYWHDGGRPGDKGRAHDFETCLNNKTCAEKAVRGYMRKYGRDCDRSGAIDCFDFARIHKLGFGQCSSDSVLDTDYWEKFEICYIGYAEDNVASNYGNNGNIPVNYGNNDNIPVNYGNNENVAAPYDYADGQLQARRVHN
ncbi:hypothetical protein AVEN_18354-1 [Araneus ventricosus]|uniref:lysozyme n=1 Tax=Araneus ventricosus TaxID=182803 RepID=A0A4Y2HPY4_ARAVE|nr:hypothetical protein AVEN_18354-1 [Araneus ventricosus]